MLKIINIATLLKIHLFASLFISLLIYQASEGMPLWKIATFAASISTVFMILISVNFIARDIWWVLRLIDDNLFPDLNGKWEGEVLFNNPSNDVSSNKVQIRAEIRQSLTKSEIDMHGKSLVSATLDVSFTRVLGLNKIYYSYLSEPPHMAWNRYVGTSILNVISNDGKVTLQGNYYTERNTTGTITLYKKKDNRIVKTFVYIKRTLVLLSLLSIFSCSLLWYFFYL